MTWHQRLAFLDDARFRVSATWVWFILGPALVGGFVLLVMRVDLQSARAAFGARPYLAAYIEIISAGFLPVLLTLICRDSLADYGLRRAGLVQSLLLSALVAAGAAAYSWLTAGAPVNFADAEFGLGFPLNLWYTALGIFAYGPLEVFFVIWLIRNSDRAFNGGDRLISGGLILTNGLFGLAHVLTTGSLINALTVAAIFFPLGLIYKHTGNAYGPMLAWTVVNGQVWYLAQAVYR
jgi:hypothetical protein